MTDFDPNEELDTQEQADAYVTWCAENFMRVAVDDARTYRSAVRSAAWLFVVAVAQLHLDDEIEENRDALMEQLTMYMQLARAIERQREHYPIERLIVLRASLDCWEAAGGWAAELLSAAKCAVSAMMVIELHPLVDLWDLYAPDAWALLSAGADHLAAINAESALTFDDFAIAPDDMVTAKFTWQRANNLTRRMGAPKLSEN